MSSGEASKFYADEKNQMGMPACHSPQRSPEPSMPPQQPSGEIEDLSKKYLQTLQLLQDVCTDLLLPRVSDLLCSHKCPARVTMKPMGRRRVGES